MDNTIHCFRANSPFRPPDWRTRLARLHHEDRLQFVKTRESQVPDEIVRQLLVFQYGWSWTPPRPDERPAIQAAQRFAETASAGELQTVQLRLLARETDAAIGERVGQPPEVIHFYERLCFDCRERIENPNYIHTHFLHFASPEPTLTDALRHCAYVYGPGQLDRVLAALRDEAFGLDRSRPGTAAEFEAALERATVRTWLAKRMVPHFDRLALPDLMMDFGLALRLHDGRRQLDPLVLPLHPIPRIAKKRLPKKATAPNLEVRVSGPNRPLPKKSLGTDRSRFRGPCIVAQVFRPLGKAPLTAEAQL